MKQAATKQNSTAAATRTSPFFNRQGTGSLQTETNAPIFNGSFLQTKLTIGGANDPYEHEADAMADKVVQRLKEPLADGPASTIGSPPVQAKCDACEKEEEGEKVQAKEEGLQELKEPLQAKPIENTKSEVISPLNGAAAPVQVQGINNTTTNTTVQPKCAACSTAAVSPSAKEEKIQEKGEDGKEEEGIQAKLSIGQPGDPYEREADAVADKVVQRSTEEHAVQKKADPVISTVTPVIQSKAIADDKLQEKKEDNEKDLTEEVQKKPVADTAGENNTIQRSCRECEEGLVFRKAIGMVQLAGAAKADGSRESIVAIAQAELGKVEAKRDDGSGRRIGADRLLEYFHTAAPGVWPDSDIENMSGAIPAWCGIFSVFAHKKAGKDIGTWQMGRGVSAFNTLQQTDNPQPGDIGYIHKPHQHHCIIKEINGDTVISIDGNSGAFSEVKENQRPYSIYTAFFTAFGGSSANILRKEEKDAPVQTKPAASSTSASSSVEQQLSSSKGGGNELSGDVRGEMEQNFGADFSNVRVHTDSSAVQMSKNLHAQAFTHGSDIYFNSGKYDPQSSSGKHLLAHELTHTLQQGATVSRKPDIQKQGPTTETPDTDTPSISQAVYDALDGWTSSADSADILSRLHTRNKSTLDIVLPEIATLAHKSVIEIFEWMAADMVTSDWRALRDHFVHVRINQIDDLLANIIYDLVSGYTSEANSGEIVRLFIGDNPLLGEQLTSVLNKVQEKAGVDQNGLAEWLFDDLTILNEDTLKRHFFNSRSTKAVDVAAHSVASKVFDKLSGYTSADDSTMIVRYFERTPADHRSYVLGKLDAMCLAEWSQTGAEALMEDIWQSDYNQLREWIPDMPVYNIEMGVLEWLWDKATILFDWAWAIVQYTVCGVVGTVVGALSVIWDIIVAVWDILVGAKNLIGLVIHWISGGRFAREEAEAVRTFFHGIGEFFGAPGDAIGRMWDDLVLEGQLIDGPFRECQQAYYWMTRIANFIVNLILTLWAGYGAVKLALKGIEALVTLVRSGELLAAIGRLPERIRRMLGRLPTRMRRRTAVLVGRTIQSLTRPAELVDTAYNTITLVRLAAENEGYYAFLRRQTGRAVGALTEAELRFWRERRTFWTRESSRNAANLESVEGQLVQAVETAGDDPVAAQAIIDDAEVNAAAARREADDLMSDVSGTGATMTQPFEERLPANWRSGMPGRPPMLDHAVTKLRGANIPEDTIVSIITNAAAQPGLDASNFFADLNVFANRAQRVMGNEGFLSVLNGLANESRFGPARFLMGRFSWNQNITEIVRMMTLEDITTLRAQFAALDDAEFTRKLHAVVSRVNGTRDDVLALINEAGTGNNRMDRLIEALDRLGGARYTPQQIRESLTFGERLAAAIATSGDETARVVWGEHFKGRDANGRILLAESLRGRSPGSKAAEFINARRRQIANAILGEGGTALDRQRWEMILDSILNTDLPLPIKNLIKGELWAFTQVTRYERLGYQVIREVQLWILTEAGAETGTFAKMDAVCRRGSEILYREFKSSSTATFSPEQTTAYDMLNRGDATRLRPRGPRAQEAFGGPDMPDFGPRPVGFETPESYFNNR